MRSEAYDAGKCNLINLLEDNKKLKKVSVFEMALATLATLYANGYYDCCLCQPMLTGHIKRKNSNERKETKSYKKS